MSVESRWFASYVDGQPPHCRRLNRLNTQAQWAAAIELAIAIVRGDAGHRQTSRTIHAAGMTIAEEYWYWPACPWNERGNTGWWLIPSRVVVRAMRLINAAIGCELHRLHGWCDDQDIVRRLHKWRRNKHWQRVIRQHGRRSQESMLCRRGHEERDHNPRESGYSLWYRKYLAPRRRRTVRRARHVE